MIFYLFIWQWLSYIYCAVQEWLSVQIDSFIVLILLTEFLK